MRISGLQLGWWINFRSDQAQSRNIAVPLDHPFRQINGFVCCIFGIEQGGKFPLFAAALYGWEVADPIAITPSHHAYRPMAFGEDMVAVGTKNLYAPWIVFWLYGHVPSLAHRILLNASNVRPAASKA
jgi:hypothetical protein